MFPMNMFDPIFGKLFPFSSKRRETSVMKFGTIQNLMDSNVQHLQQAFNDLIGSDCVSHLAALEADHNIQLLNGFRNNFRKPLQKMSFSPHIFSDFYSPCNLILNQQDFLHSLDSFSDSKLIKELFSNITVAESVNCDTKINIPTNKMPDNIAVSNSSSVVDVTEAAEVPSAVTESDSSVVCQSALSNKLSNRKKKELQKRSRKRRRRQKKNPVKQLPAQQSTLNCSSVDDSQIDELDCAKDAECTKAQFEAYNCDSCDSTGIQILVSGASSFLISVRSTSEDDSDWDSCNDSDWVPDVSDFELSGLHISNISASRILPVQEIGITIFSCTSEDIEGMRNLKAVLKKVNSDWDEATAGIDTKPKLPSKVSFASEDELVQIVPVEMYDRKGEWEMYALERMRFKKRINELEEILAPCFSEVHRTRIFEKLHQSQSTAKPAR